MQRSENRNWTAQSPWPGWAALLLLTLLVRGGLLGAQSQALDQDPDGYRMIAENLAQHGVYGRSIDGGPVFPTAYRPPLYPLLLAALAWDGRVHRAAVAGLHCVLGVVTVGLVFLLAQWWRLGRGSWLAAALVACDPLLLNQSTLVMTETLATLLAVLGLFTLTWLGSSRNLGAAPLAGAVLALAVLCRPTFLLWLVAAVAVTPWLQTRYKDGLARALLLALVASIPLLAWGARNQQQFSRLILTTTHGGYTLLLGNNPQFYRYLRQADWGTVWDARELPPYGSQPPARGLAASQQQRAWKAAEIRDDRRAYQLAWKHIQREPAMFVYACLVRVGRLWGLVPHQRDAAESTAARTLRYLVGLWYGLLYVAAGWGMWRLRTQLYRSPWMWGIVLCLSFTLVHAFYWSNLRMRAPLMPVVCLLAAAGACQTPPKRDSRTRGGPSSTV